MLSLRLSKIGSRNRLMSTARKIKAPLKHTSSERGTGKLFVAISELAKYDIRLTGFPAVTVVGPQSSGKSSVIEAICGKSLLPKGMKMATMKPMHLTTIRSDDQKFKIGEKEYRTEREARDEIDRLNSNHHVKKINVEVWSPEVYNSYLVDLPGLFVVSQGNLELLKKIKEINEEYIKDSNNIPLVIHSAPSDPATNHAIKLINKHQREKDTLGIITKVDMVENHKTTYLEDLLKGDQYKLGYGYCAVVLRNDKEIESGINIEDKVVKEQEFFNKNSQFKPFSYGVVQMRQMISDIQYERIKQEIPSLIQEIDKQIDLLNGSNQFLTSLVNNNPSRMAGQLRIMIEKLVGSSPERADFENKLRIEFDQSIKAFMGSKEGTSSLLSEKDHSNDFMSYDILRYNSDTKTNPQWYKEDTFKGLFNYGLMSATFVDNQTLTEVYNNERGLGTSIPMAQLYINDPLGKKRLQWHRYLNQYFSQLLNNDTLQTIVHDTTLKLLLEYIHADPECQNELTKQFAEYMVKEISNETYESKIKYSITAMINIEKRPQVSLFEICRYLFQYYPEHFTATPSLFSYACIKKLKIEVYSEAWNRAYLQVVSDKMAENCYRNVAVNLLDRMVEKLLEMTMDMFHKDNAIKEQNKVNDKIQKLIDLRAILNEKV